MNNVVKIIPGFLLLFTLYHTAEYFVLFQNSPFVFLLVQACFFISAWALARWQHSDGLAAWGLDVKRNWLKHLLAGMIMGVVLYGGSYLVSLAAKTELIIHIPSLKEALPQLSLFCFGVFFSSLSEDILTRGYLYKHIGNNMPPTLFVLVSAAIYLLNHIYRLADGWETCGYLFALGILFAIPLVLTRRLWFTGGMHWIGNTVYFLTHSIIKTETVTGSLSPNLLFIFWIILMIPLSVLLIYLLKLRPKKC